jgi:hypothetical protein
MNGSNPTEKTENSPSRQKSGHVRDGRALLIASNE